MEKKGIGRLLDDAFKGTAKVADEVKKVDSLVVRSTKTKLTQDDVEGTDGGRREGWQRVNC